MKTPFVTIEQKWTQETQNVEPPTVQQTDDDQDDQDDQDVEADDTNDSDNDAVQYPTALQQYQQALQNLTQATTPYVWQNIPSPAQVQQSRGTQIRNGYPSNCPAGAERCH